jgi:hypothetical protein
MLIASAAMAVLGLACGDATESEGLDAESPPTLSRMLTDTSGEHEFRVRLEHGPGVDEEVARGMLQTLELVPSAEAFPDVPASLLDAREPGSAPLEDDEVAVHIEPLEPGVLPSDYAWRTALRTPAEPSASDSSAETLGRAQQPLSFDVVLPPNASHNTPSISCNLVSLTWSVSGGSGTVCLQNRTDNTQECRAATAFIKQLTGISFPTKKSWRARLIASSSGLAVKGNLLCL